MASWMVHLRIADILLDQISSLDQTAFIVGNIAPDSGVPNEDWTAYFPPKNISHYKNNKMDDTFFDTDCFIAEYLSPEKTETYSSDAYAFYLGYYVHLLTDIAWTKDIYCPSMDRLTQILSEKKPEIVRRLKKDWYDLDFRYLAEHPDFRAFRIYENAVGFQNNYMDFFSTDAFDNRRNYICSFYRGEHGELYREYPYLTPEKADAFTRQTAKKIRDQLKLENRI